ncbi:MAG TPA: CAP domain-containing protein [Symbiobacteriaceae bacterium]|jgi:uncharacterized YkwD family protein
MKLTTRIQALAISVALLGALTAATPVFAATPDCRQVIVQTRCPIMGPVYPYPTPPTQPVRPTQPAQPTQPGAAAPAAGLTADEQQMLTSVNGERAKAGLAPLQADPALTKVARLKSQDMAANHYFSHQSPTYGSPFDMMKKFGITYRTAGENIAGNPSVAGAHTSLMNSPGHRANILNAKYTKVGIGIVKGGQYGMMFTQEFTG